MSKPVTTREVAAVVADAWETVSTGLAGTQAPPEVQAAMAAVVLTEYLTYEYARG